MNLQRHASILTRYGVIGLLVAQSAHTLEHSIQMIQYHLLRWPNATGLISQLANNEWIHLNWNIAILSCIILLFAHGMRGTWSTLLILVAGLHTIEHIYLISTYLQLSTIIENSGLSPRLALNLPGILGANGWIAQNGQNSFICKLPGLTTASRIDIHFWWNIAETSVMIPAALHFWHKNQALCIDALPA